MYIYIYICIGMFAIHIGSGTTPEAEEPPAGPLARKFEDSEEYKRGRIKRVVPWRQHLKRRNQYVYIYIYIHICYVCMYIHTYIYIYRERERQREEMYLYITPRVRNNMAACHFQWGGHTPWLFHTLAGGMGWV